MKIDQKQMTRSFFISYCAFSINFLDFNKIITSPVSHKLLGISLFSCMMLAVYFLLNKNFKNALIMLLIEIAICLAFFAVVYSKYLNIKNHI